MIKVGDSQVKKTTCRNHSVTWGKPVDLAGILPELYQVRVHVMGNICCCLIQPHKDYLVSVDTKERWHYKVLPLSLPDLQNPVRLNGYKGIKVFIENEARKS